MKYALHWLCWQPTPYNDFLFRSLSADPEIDLTVHYREKVLASHPWQSELALGFNSRLYRRVLGLDWHLLRLAMDERRSFFVIAGWNEPTIFALINLLISRRRPFAVWTDTPRTHRGGNFFKEGIRDLWLRRIFRHAFRVMGMGRVALAVLAQMGAPEKGLVNFPCFVDLEEFSPRAGDSQPGNSIPTFLSSGRLVNSLKGYDLALTALAQVKGKLGLSDGQIRYRIAGTGPDKDNLASLSRELGLTNEVEFLGWLEPQMLPNFYRSGQVLLHPAHFEPYGLSVLEAMACGLTVVGSDATGAVMDRIVPGYNGLMHRAGEVPDLAGKVAEVLTNPEKVGQMGRAARATAEEWPVNRAIGIIKEIIKSKPRQY